jgi:hypothetical protein
MDDGLLDLIITNEDQEILLSAIDQILSLLYTKESDLVSYLHSGIPDKIGVFFQNTMNTLPTIESKEQWLKKVREDISSLERLTITTPFFPSRSFLENLAKRARNEYGTSLILESRYNPDLIAGVEVVYNGSYRDMTVRTKFDQVMQSLKI